MRKADILAGIEEYVKQFFQEVSNTSNRIADVLESGKTNIFMEEKYFFSMGIEYNGCFCALNSKTKWKTYKCNKKFVVAENEEYHRYQTMEMIFSEMNPKLERKNSWCRRIGNFSVGEFLDIDTDEKVGVYYYVEIDDSDIDLLFLECLEKCYYEWLARRFLVSLRTLADKDAHHVLSSDNVKKLRYLIIENFKSYIQEIFDIDIENITALSGIYYESNPCCSNLAFLLSDFDSNIALLPGITLDTEVEFEMKNIKRIRKLLQMGQNEQTLLVCRTNNTWKVKGLYNLENLQVNLISFEIKGHMVWTMKVNSKLTVVYKCGEYLTESEHFEWEKFKRHYEDVFAISKVNKDMKKVFFEAIDQKHGTVLIVIKDDEVEKEVERLVCESTGMKIKPKLLEEKFVSSATSIDGALIVDQNGLCYGFGMILDGKVKISGNSERGARYNSTKRYIMTCKQQKIQAIGVVISEDKMVNIFTTNEKIDRKV